CFFLQAEDGIRDWSVTGVQTCALPIYVSGPPAPGPAPLLRADRGRRQHRHAPPQARPARRTTLRPAPGLVGQTGPRPHQPRQRRSEERRVGKEGRTRRERAQETSTETG